MQKEQHTATKPLSILADHSVIAPSFMSPNAGGREFAESQPVITAVHRSPNKLWRSNCTFNPMCKSRFSVMSLIYQKWPLLSWLSGLYIGVKCTPCVPPTSE